jgi:hypothetical protein
LRLLLWAFVASVRSDPPSGQAAQNTLVVLDGDDRLVLLFFRCRHDVVVRRRHDFASIEREPVFVVG